ncbi:hypothetical protein GCM10027174_31930 [Salinifilum aidingensis]
MPGTWGTGTDDQGCMPSTLAAAPTNAPLPSASHAVRPLPRGVRWDVPEERPTPAAVASGARRWQRFRPGPDER